MKQYDKIWVPEKKQGMAFRDNEGDTPSVIVGPVIVLTIEEAEKIWDAGYRARALENNSTAKWVDFKSWMEHKDIKI